MFYLKSSGTVRKFGQIYMFLLTAVITICLSVRCFVTNDSAIFYKLYLYPLKFNTALRCD